MEEVLCIPCSLDEIIKTETLCLGRCVTLIKSLSCSWAKSAQQRGAHGSWLYWVQFLAQLSWKLYWAFLIANCMLSVHLSVQLDQFQPNLALSGWQGFKYICTNEDPSLWPVPIEEHIIVGNMHWQHIKIFSWTTRPISTKLVTKHLWVKGIHVIWLKSIHNYVISILSFNYKI